MKDKDNKKIHPEPKKNNRFIVNLLGTEIEPWTVQKADRPTYSLENGWENMEIELVDIISPSTSKRVYDGIISKDMENRLITMKMLDPVGVEIEKWNLTVDYLKVDFGKGDYAKDEVSKIKIVFSIKNCILS
jgi:hypothetical protein